MANKIKVDPQETNGVKINTTATAMSINVSGIESGTSIKNPLCTITLVNNSQYSGSGSGYINGIYLLDDGSLTIAGAMNSDVVEPGETKEYTAYAQYINLEDDEIEGYGLNLFGSSSACSNLVNCTAGNYVVLIDDPTLPASFTYTIG